MKNQENMIPPKGQNNLLVTDPKNMIIQDLPNKIFKNSYFKETQGATRKHKDNSTKSGNQSMNKMSLTKR